MWLFLSVLAIALAFCFVAKTLGEAAADVARNLPYRPAFELPSHLHLTLDLPRSVKIEEESKVPVAPRDVLEFCALESESFAQQALLHKAHQLFAQLGSWEAALAMLKKDAAPEPETEVSTDV